MTALARRRYRKYSLSRAVTFGPGLALPLWGWVYLREPFRWAGLGVMAAAGLIAVPPVIVITLFFVPALVIGGVFPRRWRVRYRQRQIDAGRPRESQRSSYISASLRRVVLAADRYRCVACKARLGVHVAWLEIDHMISWRGGGRTTFFNCSALCQPCNGIKSNYSVDRDGYIHYHGYRGLRAGQPLPPAVLQAAEILRRERRHRWNPLRLFRAAWALG